MNADSSGRIDPDEVEVGDTGPEMVVEDLQREDFVRYAGASGDFNPIHYDEPHAKAAGNESVFAQGMLTAGVAAGMVSNWFGLGNVTSYGVRFQARIFPEDTITVTGEVVNVSSTDDATVVDAEFEVSNQDGKAVLSGSSTAEL